MSGKRYSIQLITEERERLHQLVRGGTHSARVVTRARILLKIDEGWKAPRIAEALDVSKGTVYGVKRRYATVRFGRRVAGPSPSQLIPQAG